jgi:hypothetical protein
MSISSVGSGTSPYSVARPEPSQTTATKKAGSDPDHDGDVDGPGSTEAGEGGVKGGHVNTVA